MEILEDAGVAQAIAERSTPARNMAASACSDVADRVGMVGERAQLGGRQVGLVRAGDIGGASYNEMGLDARVAE